MALQMGIQELETLLVVVRRQRQTAEDLETAAQTSLRIAEDAARQAQAAADQSLMNLGSAHDHVVGAREVEERFQVRAPLIVSRRHAQTLLSNALLEEDWAARGSRHLSIPCTASARECHHQERAISNR